MVFDGARADEELGGDLAVRVAIGRETRDLRLLRRELVERVGGPLSCMLARRLQFDPRALGEGVHPEVREELVRGSELVPRIDPAGSPAEPLPVDQMPAGQVEPKAGRLEPLDRLAVQRLGGVVLSEQGP